MDWRARFPGVTDAEWGDWRWQLRHALRSQADLARLVDLTVEERAGLALGGLRTGVTPYYASLIDGGHPACPVRRQVIPLDAEGRGAPGDLLDATGEETHRPVRAVVHKYPDRALFLVTDTCPIYCRHCTRRRITGGEAGAFDRAAIEEGIAWVAAHREVSDVIVSGGDPLVLSDERLDEVLGRLRAIPHVAVLRLATRAPAVLPMRVDAALAAMLRRHAPLFVVTHFNHPKELTAAARAACETLVDHGVPVENQAVLLRGLNSSARALAALFSTLLSWRVRAYYLHQGDLVAGTAHLRTPLPAGVEILRQLRGTIAGLAIPQLAVDLPDGSGKITLGPDYSTWASPSGAGAEAAVLAGAAPIGWSRGEGGTWLRNHRGERVLYPDPPESDCACPYDAVYFGAGPEGRRSDPGTT